MAKPFLRVDLSSNARDFRPMATEPGVAMLDDANVKTVSRWLGRFAAEPRREGEAVNFYVSNGLGGLLENVACRPVTSQRLHGPLKGEVDRLRQQFDAVKPSSRSEEALRSMLAGSLQAMLSDSGRSNPGHWLFEYRDPQGNRRLVWCWGYQRARSEPGSAVVCPKTRCNLLFHRREGEKARCPGCGHVPLSQRVPWPLAAAALMLLLLAVGAGWYWWSTRPTAILEGQIVAGEMDRKPIAGAEVRVVGTDRNVQTDEQGRYRLDKLPAGPIEVRVTAPRYYAKTDSASMKRGEETWLDVALIGGGFPTGQVLGALTGGPIPEAKVRVHGNAASTVLTGPEGDFRFPGFTDAAADVVIEKPGYRVQTVPWALDSKPLVVKLVGSATLKGRILCDAAEDDRPVAGASIHLVGTKQETRSNAQGEFVLEQVPGCPAALDVRADGFDAHEKVAVNLLPDQQTSKAIRLKGTAVMSGTVVDAATVPPRPIDGVTVQLQGTRLKTKTSGGHYELKQVPPGPATLVVTPSAGYRPAQAQVVMKAGGSETKDFQLASGSAFAGTVVWAGAGKRVGVPGATVRIKDTTLKPVVTGEDGTFAVEEGVPPHLKRVPVEVTAPGFLRATSEANRQGAGQPIALTGDASVRGRVLSAAFDPPRPVPRAQVAIKDSPLTVQTGDDGTFVLEGARSGQHSDILVDAAGHTRAEVAKKLDPGAANAVGDVVLQGSAEVAGKVTDDAGGPVAGAEVRIPELKRSVKTGGDGTYRLVGIPASQQKIEVAAANCGEWQDTKVFKAGANTLDVPLGRQTVLTVKVVDNEDPKQPIAGAEVSIAGSTEKLKTDEKGQAVFAKTAVRPVKLDVSAKDRCPEQVEQTLASAPNEVTVRLKPMTKLTVAVVDAETKSPIRNAQVTLSGLGQAEKTDENGRVVFSVAPGRTVPVAATAEGYCSKQVAAETTAPASPLRIPLERGMTLTGTVINAIDKKPVASARVAVKVGDVERTAVTDTNGNYRVEGVPSGRAGIAISHDNFSTQNVEQELKLGTAPDPLRTVLNPRLAAGEMRLVLVWGKKPRDLDAHLFGTPKRGQPVHVYFQQKTAAGDHVTLDADSKEGEGPETITLKRPPAGRYGYWVEDSTNSDDAKSGVLATRAAAQVTIYYEDKPPWTVAIGPVAGQLSSPVWHGFDVVVGDDGKMDIVAAKRYEAGLPGK